MEAYVLEELHRNEWRRDARVFWTRGDAERFGQLRLTLRTVRAVRLIPVSLNLAAGYALERATVSA